MAHECFCVCLINGYCCGTNAVLFMNYGFMYLLFNLAERVRMLQNISNLVKFVFFFCLKFIKHLTFPKFVSFNFGLQKVFFGCNSVRIKTYNIHFNWGKLSFGEEKEIALQNLEFKMKLSI